MRQVGDTLVWLGLILVLAAVVYFTPRLADFVANVQSGQERESVAWRVVADQPDESSDAIP
jgi:hypothetical protein